MKKNISIIVLCMLAFGVSAQSFESQSFLNVTSLQVTNGIAVTNIYSFGSTGSNTVGIVYTNRAGTASVITSTNAKSVKLLNDVSLWADRVGGIPGFTQPTINASPYTNYQGNANIYIRLVGGSGANSAVTFSFAPIASGLGNSDLGYESTSLFNVAVTATTTTEVRSLTPVPWATLWPGCKGVRLVRIVNADTDASSGVHVLECSLNGFLP